ncbi:tetratricopeptide repeat protein [Myxococcus llanfairpwllgwyngyllgogerychwyrndrobwllllantysiliogogogochensis]|uniref:Tetratricopeptide repeat protein n=1 Tax=Myxococcus llanfairpwllgwyngyllgogerychwyrndrobwllllantysiliogogogochensis TaxID=2590453 RepID=A0A540WZH5_9BACT|nr:serine/threonine-protein kinase [Myxococcus llanfairpwllgwyngyllgogerychwyrndrobwllllantysiliogogogochensis]TQF14360.1 tetratricopeptide repeat protein [Myxococcus llanfairpwllgwyngyllgogerychwyrndrobwllllantysiliogogogochensis]
MTRKDTGGRDAGTGPGEDLSGTGPDEARRAAPPFSQIGRYLLLRRLGQGGMGVVYAAYDPDLDRKVALKLLHPDGRHDHSEEARSRLLREAQAMARVSHPNVIPVFDVGMWGDQVFVAMELVDGGTLASWLKASPRSWREIVTRYVEAGRGLEAAHAAGLVHRDFKPANVLVSRAGRVYVTDFGLARTMGDLPQDEEPLTEETREALASSAGRRMLETTLTEDGLLVGTPNYMSPEQFRGTTLDGRTDQFSFCAALYGALFGARPFEPGSLRAYAFSSTSVSAESERTESLGAQRPSVAPSSPATIPVPAVREPPRDSKVPGWVRDAVLRGLSLEPDARFASMAVLLEALSQEHRRTLRRRWVTAASALGATLALTGGAAWQQSRVCVDAGARMDDVWSPTTQAKLSTAFQATGRPFAEGMAQSVSRALGDYADMWKRQRVQACEATRVQGVKPEEQLDRQLVCLERRRKDFSATVELLSSADAALVEKSLDAALALPSLWECEDTEALAERQRMPTDPLRRADIELLEEKLSHVRARMDAGKHPQALEAVKALVAPVEATGYLPLRAETRFLNGWLLEQVGESPEAAKLLSSAVFDAEAGHADRLKVTALNKLLFVEDGLKHYEPAARWGSLAEATLERMGGDPVLLGDVRVNQANLAISQDLYEEAKTRVEEARALYEKSLPAEHPKRARTTFLLAHVVHSLGDSARALALMEDALQKTTAAMGPQHPDVARRHGLLSMTLRELKQDAQALPHAQAVADIFQAIYGADSPKFAEALDEVGMCQLGMGRFEDALKTYERSLALKRKTLPADDEKLQPSYDGVGQALLGLGRVGESVEPLRLAVTFASAPPDALAESGFALAKALVQSGQSPEARGEAARARGWFTEAGLDARVGDVDTFLAALPAPAPVKPARVKPARPRGK